MQPFLKLGVCTTCFALSVIRGYPNPERKGFTACQVSLINYELYPKICIVSVPVSGSRGSSVAQHLYVTRFNYVFTNLYSHPVDGYSTLNHF